jgi:hypothetical protein
MQRNSDEKSLLDNDELFLFSFWLIKSFVMWKEKLVRLNGSGCLSWVIQLDVMWRQSESESVELCGCQEFYHSDVWEVSVCFRKLMFDQFVLCPKVDRQYWRSFVLEKCFCRSTQHVGYGSINSRSIDSQRVSLIKVTIEWFNVASNLHVFGYYDGPNLISWAASRQTSPQKIVSIFIHHVFLSFKFEPSMTLCDRVIVCSQLSLLQPLSVCHNASSSFTHNSIEISIKPSPQTLFRPNIEKTRHFSC